MIQTDAPTFRALRQRSTDLEIEVLWYLNPSSAMDISDRLLSIGKHSRSVKPFVGDFSVSRMALTLANEDRFFSPKDPYRGVGGLQSSRRALTAVEINAKVKATGTSIPILKGFLDSPKWANRQVRWSVYESIGTIFGLDTPVLSAINTVDPGTAIQTLLTAQTYLQASDFESGTFQVAQDVHDSLGWHLWGSLQDMSMGQAVHAIARSGLGVLHIDETGLVRYDTEFPPGPWKGNTRIDRTVPWVFDESNSWNWTYSENSEYFATEVKCIYRGGYVTKRDTTLESDPPGQVTKTIRAPLLAFHKSARTAAHIALDLMSGMSEVVSFTTGIEGYLVQLYDRARARDPETNVEQAYRIIKKTIDWKARQVGFVAVRDNHWDSIIDNTTFTTWGTGSWGSGTMF